VELLTVAHPNKSFLIPIIYEFLGKTKRHIIFYDESQEDEKYAKELEKSIKKLNKKYGFSVRVDMVKIDEDSKQDMQKIAKSFEGDRSNLYLNGAGADSALFTILSAIILKNGGKVLAYDIEDNSYNLITKNGFSSKNIKHNMNIEDFLILMGDELVSEIRVNDIKKRKEYILELFNDIPRVFKIRYLLKSGKAVKNYKSILQILKALDIVDSNNLLKGQQAYTKFGQLFEEYIYWLLDRFDFDDIKIGAVVRFDKAQVDDENIEVLNEFDILVIKNNRLGFIECKFGDSFEPLVTVYKSDSIMEYFGVNAVSLIVNIQKDRNAHVKNKVKNFSKSVEFRAKTKNVNIYNSFNINKRVFDKAIRDTFNVDLKELYKEELLQELKNKWG